MATLPPETPAFLRARSAVSAVGELSREPDRSKGAGRIHDSNRDPGHFVDLDEEGRILGGPLLSALPPSRSEYETALRAVGQDSWKAGYLPYSIVDQWQQLTRDLGLWRVLSAAESREKHPDRRAWYRADRIRREGQVLATIGQLSHFVGDGSQPLHVTVHYNGWGDYPNPKGYTTARIHSAFEDALVFNRVKPDMIAPRMSPFRDCGCPIEARAADYLAVTGRQAEPLYILEKAGGLAPGDPRGPTFAAGRLAAGAGELRDLIVLAWRASVTTTVGWSPIPVPDAVSGKIDPWEALYGRD